MNDNWTPPDPTITVESLVQEIQTSPEPETKLAAAQMLAHRAERAQRLLLSKFGNGKSKGGQKYDNDERSG